MNHRRVALVTCEAFPQLYQDDLLLKAALHEIGIAGVPSVICIERGDTGADIAGLARARGWDDIVVKPTISGGAYRTYRFPVAELERHRADIAHTLQDRGVLVQAAAPLRFARAIAGRLSAS